MADTKISALTGVASVADANEFAVNEAGTSKKASASQLSTYIKSKGSYGDVQTFTATGAGTWTKPTTFTPQFARVVCVAAGGGGGNRRLRGGGV